MLHQIRVFRMWAKNLVRKIRACRVRVVRSLFLSDTPNAPSDVAQYARETICLCVEYGFAGLGLYDMQERTRNNYYRGGGGYFLASALSSAYLYDSIMPYRAQGAIYLSMTLPPAPVYHVPGKNAIMSAWKPKTASSRWRQSWRTWKIS